MNLPTLVKTIVQSLILLACTACNPLGCRTVAQVGDYTLTRSMIDLREKVAQVYYPTARPPAGQKQLINAYIQAQILKNHGRPVTDQILQDEDKRIDSQTRDPETLTKVKAVFGKDHDAYLKVFILPTYVGRVLYGEFFFNSPEAQAPTKKKAEDFFVQVRTQPDQFLKLAQSEKLPINELRVIPGKGLQWSPLSTPLRSRDHAGPPMIDQSAKSPVQMQIMKRMHDEGVVQDQAQAKLWMDGVVAQTKPGGLFQSVVDMHDHWLVVKYLGIKKDGKKKNSQPSHLFQTVSFPKADFNTWLEEERKKIAVNIHGQ